MDTIAHSFILFEPHKEKTIKNDKPLVEIRPNGRIVFNKTACELLTNNHFCMLGYDQDKKLVGLLPLTEEKSNSFPIRYAAKGAYVGAKKFFKHFNILPGSLIENTPLRIGEFISIQL